MIFFLLAVFRLSDSLCYSTALFYYYSPMYERTQRKPMYGRLSYWYS